MTSRRSRVAWQSPALVVAIGLALTAGVTWYVRKSSVDQDGESIDAAVQTTASAVEARLGVYTGLLRAGAALFAVDPKLDAAAFRRFVAQLELERVYPGIQGIGFARRVRAAERAEVEAAQQREGRVDFRIRPAGDAAESFPIVFLEPLDRRNQRAIGFDMFSEPTRKEAMSRARDEGQPAATGRVELVQEIDAEKQPGFLIYVPVYAGPTPTSVEQRRDALQGFVYGPFRAFDLFNGIFAAPGPAQVQFTVYDGVEPAPDRLLFRSPGAVEARPLVTRHTRLRVADHTWLIVYQSTRAFDQASLRSWTPWVGLAGVLSSVALGAITLALARSEARSRWRGEQLLAQREELRVTLASIGDAVISTDTTGAITFMNGVAEQLTGWRLTDAQGRPLREVFAITNEDTGDVAPDPVARVLRKGVLVELPQHTVLRTKQGARIPIDDSAAPIRGADGEIHGVILVFHDVTEQRRADQELREAAERFRFMAESMPQKIFTARPDGHFDYLNKQWLRYTHQTAGQLEQGWHTFVHPDEVRDCVERWRTAVAQGQAFQHEHRVRRDDGVYRWHLTRAHALHDGAGHVRMWIGSSTDVDDQKRAGEKLERTVEERTAALRETNEQLEAFVYTVAHDLRGPLRSISGFSELLVQDYAAALGDQGVHLLERVRSSAEFMDRLILDLLAFGRTVRAEIELTPVEVRHVWSLALAQTSAQREQLHAEIETIGPLPVVRAHEATLGQVLTNLLSNAMKFTRPGTRPHVRLRAEDRGEFARLWVEDNGIGIAPEFHERIFRAFERLHGTRYQGTGIGLSIVRKGIERMGGRVGLESVVGEGTRFWIELPQVRELAAPSSDGHAS